MTLEFRPCQTITGGGTIGTQKNCIFDTATGTEEEIITMKSGGGPYGNDIFCTKAPSTMRGTAFMQKCYTRDNQGSLYSISGTGSMPIQLGGNAVYGDPVTSADPQDINYLQNVAPGSFALKTYRTYVAGWWMNTFGLRQEGMPTTVAPTEIDYSKVAAVAVLAGIGSYIVAPKLLGMFRR